MKQRLTVKVTPKVNIDPEDLDTRQSLDSRIGRQLLDLPGVETVVHHHSPDRTVLDLRPCFIVDMAMDYQGHLALAYSVTALVQAVPEVVGTFQTDLVFEPVLEGVCQVGDHPFVSPLWYPLTRPLPPICPEHAREQEQNDWDTIFAPQLTALREAGFTVGIDNTGGGCMCMVIPVSQFGEDAHLLIGDAESGPLERSTKIFGIGFYDENGESYYLDPDPSGTDVVALVRTMIEQVPTLLGKTD